ncbi:MAG: hypothetical protein KZQ83_05300 [gamma proteobacterium symbiont of Taylorina sp.]|nr:hypothetical protein [gamma proteobacterium symbiont of Taylorina sp.]
MQDFVLDEMIMTDISNEYDNAAEDCQQLDDGVTSDRKMDKDPEIELPANRVIRKRLAARTIAIHLSALPPELQVLKDTSNNAYLTKQDLPDEIHLTVPGGEEKVLSRDEAWEFADEAGAQLEWHMLPDTMSGKAAALFSTTGQGVYANYGRPTMDFSGFFYDSIRASRQASRGVTSSQGNLLLGPLFITVDAISAAGFTALGHITRDAPLTNKSVLSDIASTGIYEGSASWTSAKLGVFTGARAIRLTAVLPIPGAHLAAIPVGFLAGAVTAIFAKRLANQYKDKAIDATYRSGRHSRTSGEVIPV